ncbi:hypothetical protein HGRIS_012792 [Hohenbuehelia grisea]|uniref:Actin cytoskeleton organization protein n=1 Tax=Hohenbuehelia grisea TaxID=104357 RepID=A0ABR3ITC9_9AGAR
MSAAALERQLRPIYDSLDTGSNKSAIVACNKLLKKHPNNDLLKALKALALVRSQKVEESLVLCDEILAAKPTDDAILTAMMHVLRGLGRQMDMISMFEEAFKQQPGNEDLGAQTFFANVRAGHWKTAQQIATRMHKQFQEDRYLYWSVISAVLQANDPSTPPAMRELLYKLAHRLITSATTPSYTNADRFHLHLSILRHLGLHEEAHKLLDHEAGKSICSTSLACNELRRDIWHADGRWAEEGALAESKIVEKKDRNWLEFLSMLDAVYPPNMADDDAAKTECSARIEHARSVFEAVAEKDGLKDRSGPLALLELERRARKHGCSNDPERLLNLLKSYFDKFGSKACCFEDVKPFIDFDGEVLANWTSYLQSKETSLTSLTGLQQRINIHKLLRYNLTASEINVESEASRATLYAKEYIDALPLGAELPVTELQPADDLAILAGSAYVSLWKISEDVKYLHCAATLLEFALTRSRQCYLIRLMLVRIYRLLGAPSVALEHYRGLNLKQVQHDTLSHILLSRASTFSLASTGDLTFATECLETSQIYVSNSQETADFVVRAFTQEKYSQIPEFIAFEDRLDNSLQRDTIKMEHVRMRFTHEAITSDIIDLELIELKFIFDRNHHDNRDFAIIPNYQPRSQLTFNEQTALFGKTDGLGWLLTFLKLYIRALQQASDLDDVVEEKLLIGDRPKQNLDPDTKLPLHERLRKRQDDQLSELSSDELTLLKYADDLADWLECYHDHIRPHPSVVLAEAAKQTELKTGHPLKGIELALQENGGANGNGHNKKDEEPPAAKEPPEGVVQFFDSIKSRFAAAQNSSPVEALHVATLAQEAFIFLTVETQRFKPASVVKVHKLGPLVQSVKALRANAIAALKEISAALAKQADLEATADKRKDFIDSCSAVMTTEIDHDFVFGVAKRVTDSRKKVLDGVGKGIVRVCSSYL